MARLPSPLETRLVSEVALCALVLLLLLTLFWIYKLYFFLVLIRTFHIIIFVAEEVIDFTPSLPPSILLSFSMLEVREEPLIKASIRMRRAGRRRRRF